MIVPAPALINTSGRTGRPCRAAPDGDADAAQRDEVRGEVVHQNQHRFIGTSSIRSATAL